MFDIMIEQAKATLMKKLKDKQSLTSCQSPKKDWNENLKLRLKNSSISNNVKTEACETPINFVD